MIFKLISIALIGVVVVLLLRSTKPEFAVFATIVTGVVMVILLLSTLQDVILSFDKIVKKSGVDEGIFTAVLKIIGIGYLTEYSSSIANDAGCGPHRRAAARRPERAARSHRRERTRHLGEEPTG